MVFLYKKMENKHENIFSKTSRSRKKMVPN